MNISEEKRYLYNMMSELLSERREITNLVRDIKKRVDDLILLETRGLDEIPMKGFLDMHNARDTKKTTENIRQVAEHTVKRVEKEAEETANPPKKDVIPKKEIEIEKEKVAKNSTRRSISTDKAAGMIAHVLKEHGIPMTVADLYEAVNAMSDIPISRANFRNNMLPRSMRTNKNIDNVQRGLYQYLRG